MKEKIHIQSSNGQILIESRILELKMQQEKLVSEITEYGYLRKITEDKVLKEKYRRYLRNSESLLELCKNRLDFNLSMLVRTDSHEYELQN